MGTGRHSRGGLVAIVILVCSELAFGWTPTIGISDGPGSNAKVSRGAGGKMHFTWQTNGFRIRYRERSGNGQWGPIQALTDVFSFRPDVVEDGAGRVHVIYGAGGAGGKYDLFHALYSGGTWTHTNITNTAGDDEDGPRMAVDSTGRVHLVYVRPNAVFYRTWQSPGGWSADTYLGGGGDIYYHRPDISIDTSNRIHTVWCNANNMYYRRHDGSGWLPIITLATTDGFFSFPKVAAATPTHIAAVIVGGYGGIHSATSTNGGASWSALTFLEGGHWPNMDGDLSGTAHLVFHRSADAATGYRTFGTGGWSAGQRVANPTNWQGWADVGAGTDGIVHVVFDDAVDDNTQRISYVSSVPDTFPPGPPWNFTATAGHNHVVLRWNQPHDPDFVQTTVRTSTAGYPATPTSGSLVANVGGAPGSLVQISHTPVVNGQTYYYSIFARDASGNWSTSAQASATPYVPPDLDRDGDVDLTDFAVLQRCLSGSAVPQNDPACIPCRFDGDTDVDGADVAILRGCLSGAGIPYQPGCAG